jgi:hypothetical protein
MSQNKTDLTPSASGDELSLKEILSYLSIFKPYWKRMIVFLLIPVILFAFVGFLAAVTSPKEYDAKCTLITDQVASSGSGAMQGLAALAGIQAPGGAGSSESGLGADMYPLLLSNKPFLIELSRIPLYFATEHRTITFEKYFRRKIKKNAVAQVSNLIFHPVEGYRELFGKDQPDTSDPAPPANIDTLTIRNTDQFFSNQAYVGDLTPENKKMIAILSGRIKFTQAGKMITLSVKMPDPRLSAEATKTVLNLMIKYITKFKVGKQLENLSFLEARTAEAEVKYKEAQQRLAGFKDNNYHVIYQSIQAREQQLQNEFTLAFSVYNQFVTQLEQARIQLKKETPLFTVVEPVYIPEAVSTDPNKEIISYASTGIFVGILLDIILLIKILTGLRRKKAISQ